MATGEPMNTTFKYDWGQAVRVAMTAPKNMQPGDIGSVCGMRAVDGGRLYLVEFSDGKAEEIPEDLIEAIENK